MGLASNAAAALFTYAVEVIGSTGTLIVRLVQAVGG
jgi:hypothetical protein